ncbi:glycerophosphodiester phosphodiesterase family protein [Arthrobacter roseus]|uniref:glycerophosphodiester phosphodiesterase family protein n=1 Tax=Arthrobacter roseus TaxID=136274 RepID=UPI001963151B|nr:glycerophosphodiester phosphodiesterase family protein [Arthrobacter roseus]MBM7847719.1 glycerophosphoryl diester phosphodiesterase [Arthrobacter roseus]
MSKFPAAALAVALTATLSAAVVPAATAAPTNEIVSDATSSPLQANERNGSFDLQSHRGGRGEWTEESLAAFANSLELGVSTLELDTHLTQDGKVVVWHDDVLTPAKCADTAPAFDGDPEFPYAGDRVRELTLAQIQTMDCGYQQLPGFPEQDNIEGNRIAELADVYSLAGQYKAKKVRFNVETKVEVHGPEGQAEMEVLTLRVLEEIRSSGQGRRTTLQSFDWASLNLAQQEMPGLSLVALSSGDKWLGVGQPGVTEHLGGADIDDYDGSLALAARALGYDAVSPTWKSVTPQMIAEAHSLGLPVVPWTVNDASEMERLMDMGVDGIITDYPTTLREVMDMRGLKLPKAYALR